MVGPRPGFDFTAAVRTLCEDATRRLPEFSHIRMDDVAVSFSQTRKRVMYGTFASLTPLRFANGASSETKHGRVYRIQPLLDGSGREMLYLLTFYLPRFLDLPMREKLITALHELWHISPAFDGDLRRFPGRCYAHSGSKEEYDELMGVFADRYLRLKPPRTTWGFLERNFDELTRDHGRLFGVRYKHPRVYWKPLPAAREGKPKGPRG
jgi:predicted metallopeptidase